MSTPEPPQPNDSEAKWLAELAGLKHTPNADADTRLASLLGRLIRARFNSALHEVRAEPGSDMTRARLLAHARSYRPQRGRWRIPLAAGSGLAAGIAAAALWVQLNSSPEFGAVTSAELLAGAPDTKTLELLRVQRYLIRSRDVAGTTAQLVAHLLRAHAGVRVESKPDGRVQIDVDSLTAVDEDLARVAARLGVAMQNGTPLQITIQPP
jgi:hypothetical protein